MKQRNRRTRLPRAPVRTKADALVGSYTHAVVLLPVRLYSGYPRRARRANTARQVLVTREDHCEVIARVRQQLSGYRIRSNSTATQMRTTIYVSSETDVFFLKLLNSSLIWKIYLLQGKN